MDHPKHIVSVLVSAINSSGQLLLYKNQYSGWNIPTGTVRNNESLRTASIRTTKEQTGINVKLLRFCGIFQNLKAGACHASFFARTLDKTLNTENSNDSLDAQFFPIGVAFRMISWKIYKQRLLYSLDDSSQPFFIEF
ncbi:MAG: hypothetical protein RLZ12_670 [Bacillota bacterium]